MRMTRSRAIGAILTAFAILAAACSGSGGGAPITVSSFDFGESVILAEIYAQTLEANDYPVERRLRLGSREIVKPALENGDIDLVPEYVGSALEVGFGEEPSSDGEATRLKLAAAFEPLGVSVLALAPAQDKNGIVVTADTAAQYGLTKISDLAGVSQDLVFGGPPECPDRPRCLKGLQDVYGLQFADFKPLDVGGPLTVAALEGGEIDVALLFTTDGVIAAKGFVLLDDDKGLQPAENIVPVVRTDVIDEYGNDIVALLNGVSANITTEKLTEMNRQVGFDGADPEVVAHDFLVSEGLIEG